MPQHEIVKHTEADQAVATIQGQKFLSRVESVLPAHMGATRHVSLAVGMMRREDLQDCTQTSLVKAVLQAAQLGLELDGMLGHAYLVPFRNKGVKEAICIPGYRGLIDLAMRSGKASHVDAHVVYEGDDFDFAFGLEPYLRHKPVRDVTKRGEITAAYAVLVYINGQRKFDMFERAEIDAIQARSPASKSSFSPWNNPADWPEMAKKSILRRLLKTAALSPEVTRAASQDEYYEAGVGEMPKRGRIRFGDRGPKKVEAEDVTEKGGPEQVKPASPQPAAAGPPSSEEMRKRDLMDAVCAECERVGVPFPKNLKDFAADELRDMVKYVRLDGWSPEDPLAPGREPKGEQSSEGLFETWEVDDVA